MDENDLRIDEDSVLVKKIVFIFNHVDGLLKRVSNINYCRLFYQPVKKQGQSSYFQSRLQKNRDSPHVFNHGCKKTGTVLIFLQA